MQFAYGVDALFEPILVAREINKGFPKRKDTYTFYLDGNTGIARPLRVEPCKRLEFLVADGSKLPFRDEAFTLVSSFHVTEVTAKPLSILKEKVRVLKPQGLFLCASIDLLGRRLMDSSEPDDPSRPALEVVTKQLEIDLKILEETSDAPYLRQENSRSLELYFSHCIWAQKC